MIFFLTFFSKKKAYYRSNIYIPFLRNFLRNLLIKQIWEQWNLKSHVLQSVVLFQYESINYLKSGLQDNEADLFILTNDGYVWLIWPGLIMQQCNQQYTTAAAIATKWLTLICLILFLLSPPLRTPVASFICGLKSGVIMHQCEKDLIP